MLHLVIFKQENFIVILVKKFLYMPDNFSSLNFLKHNYDLGEWKWKSCQFYANISPFKPAF